VGGKKGQREGIRGLISDDVLVGRCPSSGVLAVNPDYILIIDRLLNG
jgi:hypothetical protein